MTLQDNLDALKAKSRDAAAADPARAAMMEAAARSTAALIAENAAGRALKTGDMAPSFSLLANDGTTVSSAELLAQGPLVVSFYRGVWCPYCNLELKALQAALSAIRETGASLVAISPQLAINSRKAVRENGLEFPILADPGNALAARFGLRFTLPDDLIGFYKARGIDLAAANGDPSWTLPMPGRFVIGRDGVILAAEVNPDYTHRPEPADLLPILRAAA